MTDMTKLRDESYFSRTEPALLSVAPRSSEAYDSLSALHDRLAKDKLYKTLVMLACITGFILGSNFGQMFYLLSPVIAGIAAGVGLILMILLMSKRVRLELVVALVVMMNWWGFVIVPEKIHFSVAASIAMVVIEFGLLAAAFVRRGVIAQQVAATANYYGQPLCFVPRLDRAMDQPFESNVR